MSTVVTADPRHAWFRDARFGMFIHWGLYSVLGRHEWARNNERIPAEEYVALADRWHPEPGAPRIWARMAREAGMRYLVLTTKHHDGFCLFGSKICAFNAVATAPRTRSGRGIRRGLPRRRAACGALLFAHGLASSGWRALRDR